MDKLNPVLGAFCTPSPDVARAQAKAIDADIMAGKTAGPLAGVPVGIKDLVYTKGIRTTSGSIIYKDYVPTEDDVVVERLKAAGAIIIGKTNVPELGYSGASYNLIFPPTNKPWNTEHTAGGSSAGSGAAVAAQWRLAATAGDPFASPPRSTAYSASRARWVAFRSIPAPRTRPRLAYQGGSRSNTSDRSPAQSPTAR